MSEEKDPGRTSRRKAMKLCGSTLAATGGLFSLSSSASAQSPPDFDPHSQEETLEFIKRHAQTPKKEAKQTWKKLSEKQKSVINAFTDVDKVTRETHEKELKKLSTDDSYDTKEITHTVVYTTEVPLVGWDLVDILSFDQDVVWDYNGDDYKNVNHSDSADLRFPNISFWRYEGVLDQNIATQSSWAEATMSGKFEFKFFQYGNLNEVTTFSGVKVYPDGSWEITEESTE